MPGRVSRRLRGPWRALLQRLFNRLERLRDDSLAIGHGDPLASRFAEFGAGSRIASPRVALINPASVAIGSDVEIRSGICIEAYAPRGQVVLRLGDRTVVGHNVRLVAVNGIHIGEDCGIGHGVTIADTIHDWTEVMDGVPREIPVDLWIPGCPPHPLTILDGLLRLLERLEQKLETR